MAGIPYFMRHCRATGVILISLSLFIGITGCTPKSDYSWEKDLDQRIRDAYSWTREDVKDYITNIYPEATDAMIDAWTADGTLEHREMDGKTMYFKRTASNLFRVDSACMAIKAAWQGQLANESASGVSGSIAGYSESDHVKAIIAEAVESGKAIVQPKPLKIHYEISVDADIVPEGETVRCWLPFPREDMRRQKDVKLLGTSETKYRKADVKAPHYSIYMEKKAVAGQPTVFWEDFEVTVCGEYNDIEPYRFAQYDKDSGIYKRFTCEQAPHIVFTEQMKELSKEITKGCKNPDEKIKAIFLWLEYNIPWAGAMDYSIIPNIAQYVLDVRHGDCGQQTLLFMTLARIAGIPCRWESGLTVQPSGWNMHDWCLVYFEGYGWVPVDPSRGLSGLGENDKMEWFYYGGTDAYRLVINDAWGKELQPRKWYPRSDKVDFQVGEVEWRGGNVYAYKDWHPTMEIEYLNN